MYSSSYCTRKSSRTQFADGRTCECLQLTQYRVSQRNAGACIKIAAPTNMESVEPTQMSSQVTTTKDTVQHTGRPKKHPNAKAVLRLFAMFVILVCAGLVASIVQGISHLLLRKRNRDLHRRVTIAMTRAFLLCGTFTLERWAGIRIITHGAAIPPDVATFCILNHCSDIDMLIGLAWLSRYGHPYPGNAKAVVKASLGAVPVFGWILKFGEFPRISRVWARDRIRLSNDIKSLLTFKTPLWYVLYPEGSRFTPEKHVVSQEYARTNGYPVLNNLLLPRTKAFIALVEELRGNVDSICDATLMFDGPIPSAKTVLSGECSTYVLCSLVHCLFFSLSSFTILSVQ